MNQIEVGKLLARASAVDGRIVTEETIVAWWELLRDVSYDDAVAGMMAHYQKSEKYLMPAHILNNVKPSDADYSWSSAQDNIRRLKLEGKL